jgi:AraC-like DNA-binding protein
LLLYIFLSFTNAQNNSSNEKSFDELVTAYSEFIYKDASKALAYALQAKGIALVNGNNEQLVRTYYYISKCHYRLNKSKIALESIEQALLEGSTIQDSQLLYKSLCLKGDILSKLGNGSKALIAYLKARELAKKLGNPIYEVAPLANIAYIKIIHKDFEEAIEIYKTILERLNTLKASRDTEYYRLIAYINIADAYLWMEKTDEAEFYNTAGLRKCSDTIKPWAYYPLLMNKAIIYYQRAKYEKCISLTKKIRDIAKIKYENLHLTTLLYLGKSAYKLHAYDEAIHYLETAYKKINSSDAVDANEKELHEFLALAYHEYKKPEKTLFHSQKYRALEKKQSIEDLKLNNEMHKLVEVAPLKTEIDKLGEELTKETRNKKELFILSIVLLLLLVSGILYYIKRKKLTKIKFEALLKKVEELENNPKEKTVHQKDKVFDEKAITILDKIANFEKEEYYLSTECSLSFMAEKLETNTSYLSKVINTYKEKSFTVYITELRINTALIRLKNNKTLQSYTIKAIAEEFGFNRQETFSRAFKAYTGIYPSQYLKNL